MKQRHGLGGYRAKPSGENPHDFFPTPHGVTKAFIEVANLPDGYWCEPAVGDGHIVQAVGPRFQWDTFDIRHVPHPELAAYHRSPYDFLQYGEGEVDRIYTLGWDVIITNPPFYLAEEFVRHSLKHATHVAMLLRLAFLESRKREAFHRDHPSDVFVLSRRPSFTNNGATDNSAYAWFVWGPGRGGRWSILQTPQTNKGEK